MVRWLIVHSFGRCPRIVPWRENFAARHGRWANRHPATSKQSLPPRPQRSSSPFKQIEVSLGAQADEFSREVSERVTPALNKESWSDFVFVCSIQILARSYAVRYRECAANETLVWQFKPIKKSINWAIWRKVDTKLKDKATTAATSPATTTANSPPMPIPKRRNSKQARQLRRRSTADGTELGPPHEEKKLDLKEKLESVGMEEVVCGGRCEGGQIQKGTYNVAKGGMYALVFGIPSWLM
jgi:hypothetical protein